LLSYAGRPIWAILLRSLHEHATTLGWLAADPSRNYPLWKTEDARQRVKVHGEWVRDLKTELLTKDSLAMFEQLAGETHPGPTDLRARARAADRYWTKRLRITDRKATFVGSYQLVFDRLRERFYAALGGAGLGDQRAGANPMVFHDLRHTFGTLAVEVWPLHDVQAYMGHADIQTTMIYVHHQPRASAADKLSQLVAQATEAETVSRNVSRNAENGAQLSAPESTEEPVTTGFAAVWGLLIIRRAQVRILPGPLERQAW
jgi:hypothetical protein